MIESTNKKILIYHCAAIGDTIVTIPLLRNICRNNPGAVVDVFNFQPGISDFHIDLISELGGFHRITNLQLPPALSIKTLPVRIKNLLKIRMEKYDEIFVFYLCPPPSWWTKLFRLITRPKYLYIVKKTPSGMRISESIRLQLEKAGFHFLPEETSICYPLSPRHIENGAKYFSELTVPKGKTPFVMGISGKSNKCMYWPMARYEELLKRIVGKYNLFPIIIGAPSEKEKAESLLDKCRLGAFVCDLRAPDIIAFMKNALFYLGNDTGTMHLADSAGIPCITLFTNKDPYRSWFPEGEHHINIIHQQQCGECKKPICPYGDPAPCIGNITVDEVETAVVQMLKQINHV